MHKYCCKMLNTAKVLCHKKFSLSIILDIFYSYEGLAMKFGNNIS